MPRPTSPLDLVFSPGGLFPYPDWEYQLRTWRYFRLFGFNHYRQLAGIHDYSEIENNKILDEAKKIVAKDWGAFLPPAKDHKDGIGTIGKNQIERARQRKLLSFQSACIAIIALELVIREKGKNIDIYKSSESCRDAITICPATFCVVQYNEDFYHEHINADASVRSSLFRFTSQTHLRSGSVAENVFTDMAKDRLVTEHLASKFLEYWSSREEGTKIGPVLPRDPRYNGQNGLKVPQESQTVSEQPKSAKRRKSSGQYMKVSEMEIEVFPIL